MSASDELEFTEWQPKPVVTRHVQFTGFGDDGNGWAILEWLRSRGVRNPYGRDNAIYFETNERAESIARIDYWFIDGTQAEIYAITPEVHADKYERVAAS